MYLLITFYIRQLFEVEAFRFISKPIDHKLFEKYFFAAYKKLNLKNEYYIFSFNQKSYRLLLDDIIEREMCEEILSRMNARQKFAVLSYYVEGNSQKEIAERMKTTQQAVAGLIIRTVDRIRNEMKNADGEMEVEKNKKCTFGVVF